MACFTLTLTAVAIGGAYAALDEYEEMMHSRLTPLPPMVPRIGDETFQRWFGSALAKLATAEAAMYNAVDQHMEACRRAAEDGIPYTYGEDMRIGCIGREGIIQAWEIFQSEIFRTAGSSAAVDGSRFERIYRDLSMLNSHRNTVLREWAFGEIAREHLGLPRRGGATCRRRTAGSDPGSNGNDQERLMTTTDTTIDTGALREGWTEVHGPLNAAAEELLRQNPGYFSRVLDFTAHAWRHGPLEPKVKALVLLAVDSAACHLNGPGAADDVRRALAVGATPAEVLETLELTSTMGIHAANTGVPILLEELAAAGRPVDMELALTERQQQIKAEFTAKRRLLERVLGRHPAPRRRVLRHLHRDVVACRGSTARWSRRSRSSSTAPSTPRPRTCSPSGCVSTSPMRCATERPRGADGGVRARQRDRGESFALALPALAQAMDAEG